MYCGSRALHLLSAPSDLPNRSDYPSL